MLINRHNYEEFFLLYVDNELPVAERKAVEAFVEQNPDLEEELVMMMQSVLRPDTKLVFNNKESLLKNIPANGLVNESNYEEYFVLYGDNELSNEEKDLVEQFVYKHPQYQSEFELIQQARLIPDQATLYPDKNELYRTEDDDRVIPFRWWRIAAAAIVLLFLGVTAWYMTNSGNSGDGSNTDPKVADVKTTTDSNVNKQDIQPSIAVKEEEKSPAADAEKNLATATEKKSGTKRNIGPHKIVTPERPDKENDFADLPKKNQEQVVEPQTEEDKVIAKPMYAGVETNSPEIIKTGLALTKEPGSLLNKAEEPVYYYIDEEEDIKLANASISKKPVRGLIRKVKGLFEGNNDDNEQQPEQENKKGIRIAAFSIALK